MATAAPTLPAPTPGLRDGATLRVPTTTATTTATTTTAAWVSTACAGHHPTCVSSQTPVPAAADVRGANFTRESGVTTSHGSARRYARLHGCPLGRTSNTHVAVSWAYCARSGKSLFEVCWALPWAVACGPYCSCLSVGRLIFTLRCVFAFSLHGL